MGSSTHPVYAFDGFTLDPGHRSLTRADGAQVPLTGKAFDALVYLVEHAGRVVTRTELHDALWPAVVVEENNLSQVISALRRAVGEACVTTIARRGYQFVADVRTIDAPPAPLAQGPSHPEPQPPTRRAGMFALLAVGAITLGTVQWFLQRAEQRSGNPFATASFTRLTEFEGAEEHAAISRDGRHVAFLSDRDGQWDVWVGEIGQGDFRNLTQGRVPEVRNPAVRALGFSPDGSLVMIWTKKPAENGDGMVDAGWAVPTVGGSLRPYLPGIAELDFSPDGQRIAYHTSAEGDPMFVTAAGSKQGRLIQVAPAGVHNHFPLWSPDGEFLYYVRGVVPDAMDLWRIGVDGGEPERLTHHDSRVSFPVLLDERTLLYLATDEDGSGPWLHAYDLGGNGSRRINTGVEPYRSIAASADGRRVVVTVARPSSGLWRLPVDTATPTDAGPVPIELPTPRGASPRYAGDTVVYRAPRAGTESLWRSSAEGTVEISSGIDGRVAAGAAVSPDGGQLAVPVTTRDMTALYVLDIDGSHAQPIAAELDIRGAPAWSPDGRWIAVAALQGEEPRLFKVPLVGESPVQLGDDYARDPAWAPSGEFLVYTGADVGTELTIGAINADGTPHAMPDLALTRGSRRLDFLLDDRTLVFLKGTLSHKDLWAVDLATGEQRPLSSLGPGPIVTDFDVAPDGSEIVFDRVGEASDLVLIERP